MCILLLFKQHLHSCVFKLQKPSPTGCSVATFAQVLMPTTKPQDVQTVKRNLMFVNWHQNTSTSIPSYLSITLHTFIFRFCIAPDILGPLAWTSEHSNYMGGQYLFNCWSGWGQALNCFKYTFAQSAEDKLESGNSSIVMI